MAFFVRSMASKLRMAVLVTAAIILSAVYSHAGLTQNDISQLYVSIFNRASEGEGNAYWRNRADLQTMPAAATAMLDTDAARNYFGASLNSNQAFIEHIYRNTLNKTYAEDTEGINFWVGELNKGKTRGEVVAEMVGVIKDYAPNGPYYNPDDPVTIAAYNQFTNRVNISNYMAETVETTPDNWETVTKFDAHGLNVTFDEASVDTAKQAINQFSGPTGNLADDVEYYLAMLFSAGEVAPDTDEISALLGTILGGDTSVVTITPPLQNIDLSNLPPSINIRANFGSGYTPEGSNSVYTGLTVIDITGISFTQTGISANATLNATDVRRDGTLVLNGNMTMGINAGMLGETISLTAEINFSNFTTMDSQIGGSMAINIPGISSEGQLAQPATLTLNQLATQGYLVNGTVTITQTAAPDVFDVNFNVITNEGPVTGILRVQMSPGDIDQTILSTPSGPLTVGDATMIINQVIMDPDVCEDGEFPISGNIVVTRGPETATINFSNCAYTVN